MEHESNKHPHEPELPPDLYGSNKHPHEPEIPPDLYGSNKHPHEPKIPPLIDADGRCLVCLCLYRLAVLQQTLKETLTHLEPQPPPQDSACARCEDLEFKVADLADQLHDAKVTIKIMLGGGSA